MSQSMLESTRHLETGRRALSLGDSAAAEAAFRSAVESAEREGPESEELAVALATLAQLDSAAGRMDEAADRLRRSLSIREQVLGVDHAGLVAVLQQLGILAVNRGDSSAAESYLERALHIAELRLGASHPELATTLNNLAQLHLRRAAYTLAEPLLRRLLEIRSMGGEERPEVATVMASLASVHHALAEHDAAERLRRRVLEIRERTLAPEHFAVATSLEQLAETCAARGKLDEALLHLRRALAIRVRSLEPGHRSIEAVRAKITDLEMQRAQDGEFDTPAAPLAAIGEIRMLSAPATPGQALLSGSPSAPGTASVPGPVTSLGRSSGSARANESGRAGASGRESETGRAGASGRASDSGRAGASGRASALGRSSEARRADPDEGVSASNGAAPLPARDASAGDAAELDSFAPARSFAEDLTVTADPVAQQHAQSPLTLSFLEGGGANALPAREPLLALDDDEEYFEQEDARYETPFQRLLSRRAALAAIVALTLLGTFGVALRGRADARDGFTQPATVATNARGAGATGVAAMVPFTPTVAADSGSNAAAAILPLTETEARETNAPVRESRPAESPTRPSARQAEPEIAIPTLDGRARQALVAASSRADSLARGMESAASALDTRDASAAAASSIASGRIATGRQMDARNATLLGDVPEPEFPPGLHRLGAVGEVILSFTVDVNGRVDMQTVRVIRASNNRLVDPVRAVLPQLRFSPATLGDRRIPQAVEMPFRFNLRP